MYYNNVVFNRAYETEPFCGGNMSDKKDTTIDELREAYEADKERRNVREDELQAAKDYLGVLLREIEEKNKELEAKKAESAGLADALRKSENEKEVEVKATKEARESGRYKSIWIGISIIEFLTILALLVSFFIVCGKLKADAEKKQENIDDVISSYKEGQIVTDEKVRGFKNPELDGTYDKIRADYELLLEALRTGNLDLLPKEDEKVVEEPLTAKITDDLAGFAEGILLRDGFTYRSEKIDGLEYLVFLKDDLKVCYKNEYFLDDRQYKYSMIVQKGDKRIYEHINYDFSKNPSLLCPMIVKLNGSEMVLITDYAGYGSMPELFRMFDVRDLTEYNGDDMHGRINKLINTSFSEDPSGLAEAPFVLNLSTTKASYKYGFNETGFNEIGYSGNEATENELIDIVSEFRLEFSEEGISWLTEVKIGSGYYLGELRGELTLGYGTVLINNAKFGAFVPYNVEDPELLGIIIPAESVPENYLTIGGRQSETYYVAVNENITKSTYDVTKLDVTDRDNWVYYDENGKQVSIRGIDVSRYQEEIDWKQVAKAGVKFAMIRAGFRGINEGTLETDPYFEANMKGAAEAGIQIGVYFFSQAVNKTEAVEEADYVANLLTGYEISYPVVFDTERYAKEARANDLSVKDRTDICIAFCDRITELGYTPMIYANTKYMVMGLDLERLEKYDKWFACYTNHITMPYDFKMLQYSDTGVVPGIKGNVDMDISFVDYSKNVVKKAEG